MTHIYRPNELIAFLQEIDAHPKKNLSQHFLIDANIVHKIIKKAKIEENDTVLEIGPGPGVLTEALLKKKANIIAIEKDKKFAKTLNRYRNFYKNNLIIYEADFLKFPLETLPKSPKIKVVANLPYQITSPILERLISYHDHFSSFTLMIQKEMAKRITSKENTKEYSSFTVFLQTYAQIEYICTISPFCFYPRPKVSSAIVHLTLKTPFLTDLDSFHEFVRTAFQQRRKMMKSSLQSLFNKNHIIKTLKTLDFPLSVRPQQLTQKQFRQLYETLVSSPLEP